VTDTAVPEGHQGLHNTLYSKEADKEHDVANYRIRKGEDDGSTAIEVGAWLEERDGEKPLGVYEIQDHDGNIQYIGYARNMVTAIRGHLSRVGPERCVRVRAMVFANKAMATREHVEREVAHWLDAAGTLPPGNGPERELWEGPSERKVMSAAELAEYNDKAAKLKLAMGDKGEVVLSTSADPEKRREDMKRAMEGNWSEVIDGQTKAAVSANAGTVAQAGSTAAAAAAAPSGPLVSPFQKAAAHRSIGGSVDMADARPMTKESVDQVLNEVRPYLVADGGDVEVVEVENGYVFLRLQGSCSTCASSQATMKMGIERSLKLAFGDQLKDVIQVDKQDVITASVQSIDMHLNMLRGAINNFGGSVEVLDVKKDTCLLRYKGPKPIGKGVQAAIKDRFPEIKEVILID